MSGFKEQLQKKAKKTRLTSSEFSELRQRLSLYIEYYPLPKKLAAKKTTPSADLAAWFGLVTKIKFGHISSAATLAVVIIATAVPLVAERSIPGDTLYLVKVHFNEEIRSTLTLSPYEKVAWETRRIERRIAEARLLASEGKLTDEFETKVAAAVREHTAAVEEEIAVLRESDTEEAAIAEIVFESALEVQSAVLADSGGAANTTEGTSVVAIEEVVNEVKEAVANKKGTTTPSYKRLRGKAEVETTRVAELLESIRQITSTDEVVDINRRVKDIHRKLDKITAIKDSDEEQAKILLIEILSDGRKLIAFMTDIDVRENVTVEELVPVELTEVERLNLLKLALVDALFTETKLKAQLAELSEAETASGEPQLAEADNLETNTAVFEKSDAEIREELNQGLTELRDLIVALEAAIENEALESGEEIATILKELTQRLMLSTDAAEEEKERAGSDKGDPIESKPVTDETESEGGGYDGESKENETAETDEVAEKEETEAETDVKDIGPETNNPNQERATESGAENENNESKP